MNENVFLRVNKDLRKELKILSAEEDISMISMLQKLIEMYKGVKDIGETTNGRSFE